MSTRQILDKMLDEMPEELLVSVISYINSIDESVVDEMLTNAILVNNAPKVRLETDENGNIIVDKDLHPHIYDWVVNG